MWVLIAIWALVLAGLGVVLEMQLWPSDSPAALLPVLTVAFSWPALILFSTEGEDARRGVVFGSGLAALLIPLATYVGWQATPVGAFEAESVYAVYVMTLLATGFVALAYLQPFVASEPVRYAALFARAWRNLLGAGLAALLLGGCAILLTLWAALFATLGIDVLAETFPRPWFMLPAAAVAFGTGVLVFRTRQTLMDGIVGLIENLARYLLPMVLAIIVVFVVTLPFVSLQALWDTGNGSLILIALNAIAVVLAIVAYRPDTESPYPPLVHLPVTVAVALLPIVSALALLGIGIRVDQYGWTVARAWAFTGAAVLALFSVGYAWAVVRHRGAWPRGMATVNVAMGWVILGVLLLINTPVLDFRAISTRSQIARIESGEIHPGQFDFRYAREMLARPGYFAAQRLIEQLGFDPLAYGTYIGGVLYGESGEAEGDAELTRVRDEFWREMHYRGGRFAVPDDVRVAINGVVSPRHGIDHPTLARVELGGDPDLAEYLLLGVYRFDTPALEGFPARVHYRAAVYAIVDTGQDWEVVGLSSSGGAGLAEDSQSVVEALRQGRIERAARRYDDLWIGDTLYGLPPGAGTSDRAKPQDAEPVELPSGVGAGEVDVNAD